MLVERAVRASARSNAASPSEERLLLAVQRAGLQGESRLLAPGGTPKAQVHGQGGEQERQGDSPQGHG